MATPVSEIQRSKDVPEKIGKYVIINKIGKGSTGMVYLSHDPYYRRDVAIKVYNIEEDADADRAQVSRKMFFNEAHMVGMLQHPNIMPIYDAGEEDGKYYVVTEHIQGARTLAAYCRPDNLLRVDDVVEIVYKCAKALHYAHGRGQRDADDRQRRAHHRFRHRYRQRLGSIAHRRHCRFAELHVARAGAVGGTYARVRPVFTRRGYVRIAERLSPVPRG
jgi:serine/threonine protein kinase